MICKESGSRGVLYRFGKIFWEVFIGGIRRCYLEGVMIEKEIFLCFIVYNIVFFMFLELFNGFFF